MRWCLLILFLVTGCPAKRGATPTASGVGCPAASGVYIASYLTPDEGAAGQRHTGWVLPLHDRIVETLDGVPEYAALDAAAASAAGVPAPPTTLWLLAPDGPCKATIGSYYAAAIDAPTKNIAYGVELTGCAAPPDDSDASAIALVSDASPTQCKLVPPRPVAQRLGDADRSGAWSRPTKETPMPPAFAAVVPLRDCIAPGCEALWSVAQVDVAGKPVAYAGAVNWWTIPDGATPQTQCEWRVDTFSGFFVVGPDGAAVQVTEGQNHPLLLSGVLADASGPKVLLAAGPGEYTAYDLANGRATVGRHLVWLVPHPDSYTAVDRLGPVCGAAP
ncbi:MAG: hypothetical protein H0T89_16935 [Deltaproteobacteria bacterium]|nr:hypothetical protein [Deltaproteobacteria bacterium]MDQ3297016.1 hypothetical protein [Myxococcota bacterium]